jgi:hypothetical protein
VSHKDKEQQSAFLGSAIQSQDGFSAQDFTNQNLSPVFPSQFQSKTELLFRIHRQRRMKVPEKCSKNMVTCLPQKEALTTKQ